MISATRISWLLLCGFLLMPSLAWGERLPLLVGEVDLLPLNPFVDHFADPTREMTLAEARRQPFAPLHAKANAVAYSFGFSSQAHWLRVSFKTGAVQERMLLQQSIPHLHQLDVWLIQAGSNSIEHFNLGGLTPLPLRAFPHETLIQPLHLLPHTEYELLMRAQSFQTVDFQLTLWSEAAFMRKDHEASMQTGLFFGGILLMLLYHLMLTARLHDRAYLFYSLYLGIVAINVGIMQGVALQYLWPNHGEWNAWGFALCRAVGYVFVAQFITAFLQLPQRQPRLHRTALGTQAAVVLALPLAWGLPYFALQAWIDLVMLIGIPLLALAATRSYRAGYKEALHLATGLGLYFTLIVSLALRHLGWTPHVYADVGAAKVAIFANMVLFSLALADRVRSLQQEREAAQTALMQETQRHAKELEDKVKDRTNLLQAALHEAETNQSKLLETQAQMVQAEKMASLGSLVAGVAHEINNPTSAILLNAFNLQRDLQQLRQQLLQMVDSATPPEVLQQLEKQFHPLTLEAEYIQDASNRIKNIVADLRSFSRLDETEQTQVDLVGNLLSTLRLIQTQFSGQVEFRLDLAAQPQMECRPTQLNQVFLNLLVNACQAILATGRKGSLFLQSRIVGNELALVFQDDGCGMSAETQKKMFDPFFTTKPVGQGTGLGLSISFGIVRQHQGRFEVQSAPGQGTKITLWLPLAGTPTQAISP